MRFSALRLLPGVAVVLSAAPGCQSEPDVVGPSPAPSATLARPLDRLGPGELAVGKAEAFGFVAPREMRLERRYPDTAHFVGNVRPESVSNYVRERVLVAQVEVGPARTIFPKVTIKGGAPERVYRIDVVGDGPLTRLVIRDITPPPTTEGLSEQERWKRAGFGPDGTPLNPKQLQ